ncbi:MAG: putative sulfate exporter family transporter [Bacteroidales bacterium]|nr:putative sulfate exporter family transporter [Bacteroidales bacterium]MDD4528849.1 putative sulfate exporter family transporter [Bacteroidales bacterium]MDD4829104.1 putative sulfate exporter family transporter [Bacteroidales bacterium]
MKKLSVLYYVIPFLCLMPFFTAPIALAAGILLTLLKVEKPYEIKKYTSKILQWSIVLMGFGMSLQKVVETSQTGVLLTATSVFLTFLFGLALGYLFKVEKNTTMLISSGTAICGGSAIAAVSPIINAKNNQITFALTVIFVLNAIALFIFPIIGHALGMSQESFGYWSAIAIHDTSSVVGAGAAYGSEALEIATTVKLTRTLWIIPLSFLVLFINRKESKGGKVKIPWFILYFVIAIILAYYLPSYAETFNHLNWLGKKGMVIALFLIGTSFSLEDMKTAGLRAFLLGIILWLIISLSTLFFFLDY